jgi:hypothetical protein
MNTGFSILAVPDNMTIKDEKKHSTEVSFQRMTDFNTFTAFLIVG